MFLEKIVNLVLKYRRVLLYLFFGVVTTLVNIISYKVCTNIFEINYLISNVIAWIIAVIVAYLTNKKYVFKVITKNLKEQIKEFITFILARIVSLIVDMIIMYLGVSILVINDTIVKIISNIIIIILNYFFSKIFVFRNKRN